MVKSPSEPPGAVSATASGPAPPGAYTALVDSRVHLPLMLVLTFTTGVIDAIGFLGLDRVFVGNMTGNVVILGMAIGGGNDLPIVGPALALATFMAGALISGRLSRYRPPGWVDTTSLKLSLVSALMLICAVMTTVSPNPSPAGALPITGMLGAAMGIQAGAARHIGVKDVTTVVVTSTLTGLAADSRLGAARAGHTSRRSLAVILILVGATVGALLLRWGLAPGLYLTGILTGSVALAGRRHHKQWHIRETAAHNGGTL